MTITNTNLNQSINAIFRDAVLYTSSDLKLLITNENTNKTTEYVVDSVQYNPNYAVINYNIDVADQFRDGDNYLIKVLSSSNNLLYTDKVYVTSIAFDSSKQNITNNDYIFVSDSDNYTVINN